MSEKQDDLETRRWFRQRLAELAIQYPQLTTPESMQRLDAALAPLEEEDTPCPESPQADPQADPQEPDTSTTPNASR